MMKHTGRAVMAVLLLALGVSQSVYAAVSAEVDRSRIAMGDTLRLTLSATDGEDVADADLQPLRRNFEILQRSSSNNISIINGRRSSTRQLVIDLSPLKEGVLEIPALRIEKSTTQPLRVAVTPAPDINTGGQPVLFEALVDKESVYVQGQLILTLRLSLAINLESGNIPELELDNAFVRQLERNSFLRTIDGRPWRVHEVRYAVFPEQSGELVIPAQAFSGRISEGRRGLFDLNRGRLLRRNSEPVTVKVLPKPAQYSGTTWLPARNITLTEEWSIPPGELKAGESATRTISIIGEGLQGAQLPPIFFAQQEGLKYYPDQPQISEQEITSGLQGVRIESAALVPTRAGQWTVPEVRIPWWDTESEQVRYAVLPAQSISVTASAQATLPPGVPDPSVASPAPHSAVPAPGALLPWQIASLIATLGWIFTAVLYWRTRRTGSRRAAPAANDNSSEKQAFRKLLKACQLHNGQAARDALLNWAATLEGAPAHCSVQSVSARLADEELDRELGRLDEGLYNADGKDWRGDKLASCLKRLRNEAIKSPGKPSELRLYPTSNPL